MCSCNNHHKEEKENHCGCQNRPKRHHRKHKKVVKVYVIKQEKPRCPKVKTAKPNCLWNIGLQRPCPCFAPLE